VFEEDEILPIRDIMKLAEEPATVSIETSFQNIELQYLGMRSGHRPGKNVRKTKTNIHLEKYGSIFYQKLTRSCLQFVLVLIHFCNAKNTDIEARILF